MKTQPTIIALTCVAIIVVGYNASRRPAPQPLNFRESSSETASTAPEAPRKKKKGSEKQVVAVSTLNQHTPTKRKTSLRDPFFPTKYRPVSPQLDGRLSLEQLELSDVKLVAIVRDIEGRRAASVEDRNGIGFLIRTGTRIGPHGAYVKEISSDTVLVIAPKSAGDAALTPEEHSLKLRNASGEARQEPSATY